MAILLTTTDQFLGTCSWYPVTGNVYYGFDVYGKIYKQYPEENKTHIQLYAVAYTNTGSYYWNENASYSTFRILNESNTTAEYTQARGPFVLGTVSTTSKWISSMDVIVTHKVDGSWENRRWNFDHIYYPNKFATDKYSEGHTEFDYFLTLPSYDVSSIKVYMGSEYKKGNPYIYQSGVWKKGKGYVWNGSMWIKGK